MEDLQLQLVSITNANPRPLAVWRGSILQDTIRSQHNLKTPLTDNLAVSYPGKGALVVFQVDGNDLTDDEWIQKVGSTPVKVSPDLAYKVEQDRGA